MSSYRLYNCCKRYTQPPINNNNLDKLKNHYEKLLGELLELELRLSKLKKQIPVESNARKLARVQFKE